MERFSGWTQSNHTGLQKKRTFPNCDQKKKAVTMVSESEGGHVAGFEDGRRGPRAKKCKLLLKAGQVKKGADSSPEHHLALGGNS